MKKKWFYPLQTIADDRMDGMYPDKIGRQLVYQAKSRGRIIEHWMIFRVDKEPLQIMSVMIRHGSNTNVSLLVFEMKFVASN